MAEHTDAKVRILDLQGNEAIIDTGTSALLVSSMGAGGGGVSLPSAVQWTPAPMASAWPVQLSGGGLLSAWSIPVGTQAISGAGPFSTGVTNTLSAASSGATIIASAAPVSKFGIQVSGQVAVPTAWDARLEGSLDGANFSQILQHTNTTGDGAVVWSGSTLSPALYFRARLAGITLGVNSSGVQITVLGMQ